MRHEEVFKAAGGEMRVVIGREFDRKFDTEEPFIKIRTRVLVPDDDSDVMLVEGKSWRETWRSYDVVLRGAEARRFVRNALVAINPPRRGRDAEGTSGQWPEAEGAAESKKDGSGASAVDDRRDREPAWPASRHPAPIERADGGDGGGSDGPLPARRQ